MTRKIPVHPELEKSFEYRADAVTYQRSLEAQGYTARIESTPTGFYTVRLYNPAD